MSEKVCFCNKVARTRCCTTDCTDKTPGADGCYPCQCSKGHERCIQTGQLRGDRRR